MALHVVIVLLRGFKVGIRFHSLFNHYHDRGFFSVVTIELIRLAGEPARTLEIESSATSAINPYLHLQDAAYPSLRTELRTKMTPNDK